ncbi:MAG: hypothetical protein WBG92_14925 [Thiohalocapsa sp.]
MNEHYSVLPGIIARSMPARRWDSQRQAHVVDGLTRKDLDQIAENADTTLITFAAGLGTIGEMLTVEETAKELPSRNVQTLGELVVTLGESICALSNLRQRAAESEPGIPPAPTRGG